jgi:hypothetical protein
VPSRAGLAGYGDEGKSVFRKVIEIALLAQELLDHLQVFHDRFSSLVVVLDEGDSPSI